MVKRAKLTLVKEPAESDKEEQPRSTAPEREAPAEKTTTSHQGAAQPPAKISSALGKTLLVAGLTIVSLLIFKRKIF
jgi:hypothetical protein